MLIPAIANFFQNKVVSSVIIFALFSKPDQIKLTKEFSNQGVRVAFSSDPVVLEKCSDFQLQGVLYIEQQEVNYAILKKVNGKYFAKKFKWLLIADKIPYELNYVRYDSDVVLMRSHSVFENLIDNNESAASFYDIYVHPKDGASMHIWGYWTPNLGLTVTHDWDRILRRKNLKKYSFTIAAPYAHYSEDTYNGTFMQYLVDITAPDSGLRCGYGASNLLIQSLNATEKVMPVLLWNSDMNNSSMVVTLETGIADLSGGVLRLMDHRLARMDYITPMWLLSVGFTYLAERESSSNMFVAPFTSTVWLGCLIIGLILALVQRATSRKPEEKEGAFMAVVATWLQQDASAVPEGASGRWTFIVLSTCSMLVHAYYTSAIVSSLMNTGRNRLESLRELADSRLDIASEDHDFIRLTMFDVETTWDDLEYLKKKKMTSRFYQDINVGVELVRQGYTAYHGEYHQLYPYLNTFSDDEICKMQQLDTIPESVTWVTASPRGQYSEVFRVAGAWLHEAGLAKRLLKHITTLPPPCRAALLAERVTMWDIMPLLALTAAVAVCSFILLGMEIFLAKWSRQSKMPYKASSIESILEK